MANRQSSRWVLAGLVGSLVVGCTDKKPETPSAESQTTTSAAIATVGQGTPTTNTNVGKYEVPFAQAVTLEKLDEQLVPPDSTIANKPTAVLREAVEKMWPSVVLTNETGQPKKFVVTLESEEGPLEITLQPELAPNHVRSFLALVNLGYYDGLRFDRIVHQEAQTEDGKKIRIEIRMEPIDCFGSPK